MLPEDIRFTRPDALVRRSQRAFCQSEVRRLSEACSLNFIHLISSLNSETHENKLRLAIEDDFAQFKMWCSELGALRGGRSALDARLTGSPELKEDVLLFLNYLREYLENSWEITQGNDSSDNSSDDSPDPIHRDANDATPSEIDELETTELGEYRLAIKDVIGDLRCLSSNIQYETHESLSVREMCRQQLESVTVSELFSEWAKLDAQFVDSALGRMASNMGKGPNTPPFLVARLSTALTNRRRFFALWRKEDCMELAQNEHEMSKTQISRSLERLDNQKDCLLLSRKEYFTEGPLPEVESPTGQFLDDSAHKRGYVLLPNRRLLGEARLKTEVSLITAPEGVLLSETPEPLGKEPNTHKPSTGDHHSSDGPRSADPEHKLRDCFSYDGIGPDSPTSSLTSTRRWGDWPVEFPPPPPEVESDMDSTCHYCWTSCPSYEGRGSAWRDHILADLQPYVCTYEDCPHEDTLYSSRQAWMEHEGVCHRRIWRCFAAEHQDQDYKSLAMLKAHIMEEHKELTIRQIITLLPFLAKTMLDDRTACPFCGLVGPFENSLSHHMAAHQELLAQFAIPRIRSAGKSFANTAPNGPRQDDKSTVSGSRRGRPRRVIHRSRNSLDAAVCDGLERIWRDE